MPADESTTKRVLPEYGWVHAGFAAGKDIQHAARHRDIANMMEAQADHSSSERLHLSRKSKQWRIRHLQALRRERLILRKKFDNFLYVELFDRLLQIAKQRGKDGWDGWELTQPFESLQENFFGRGRGGHDFPPAGARSPFT